MKTRNAGTPKKTPPKKTHPAKKPTFDSPSKSAEPGAPSSTASKTTTAEATTTTTTTPTTTTTTTPTTTTKRVSVAKGKQVKPVIPPSELKEASPLMAETKVTLGTKKVVRKVIRRVKSSGTSKAVSTQAPKPVEVVRPKVEVSSQDGEMSMKDMGAVKQKEELVASKLIEPKIEEEIYTGVKEPTNIEQTTIEFNEPPAANIGESGNSEQLIVPNAQNPIETEEHITVKGKNVVREEEIEEDPEMDEDGVEDKEANFGEDRVVHRTEHANMEENVNNELVNDVKSEDDDPDEMEFEECGLQKVLEEPVEEEQSEDDDDVTDPLEEEHMELTAHAKERRLRKEVEIFVGGLDRDATEVDVKNAFEKVGEVVEVRLHMNSSTNKNKGYAFVKFADKEQASRALTEMRNPIICGKRCGAAPSEDNDTLFLGNICNTWTKEAIKQKLKDYGIEGVEKITLVSDPRHEGLSRGFAFLEFSCHADAMLAYKRLQKPDAIFGHSERTAKVAFAEPLREPDPEIMSQVKSVFVDGLPPHWDEDRVREQFKGYGMIEKIVLARNMSTAKRKDFGFVEFTTHEAAVSCVDGVNSTELFDGFSKIKVRARLSNPLPKTQAVKGGMCGGFRIGRGGVTPLQYGRNFGRGQPLNRVNFQHGRNFFPFGRGHPGSGRMGFMNEQDFDTPYSEFHGRQFYAPAGRRGGIAPFRQNFSRPTHSFVEGGRGGHLSSRRPPFSPEAGFGPHFASRYYDDPYMYDDMPHGLKRPLYMADPGYMEPSRFRPRMDYSDPAISFHEPHYRDTSGSGGGLYSHDYYGSDYEGTYRSYYGADRPYYGADHSYYGADRSYRGGFY